MVDSADDSQDFAVVMTLKRKDGSSCDLRVYADDDPREVAKEYCLKEGLGKKAVDKLALLIESKRDDALSAHIDDRTVVNASSIDDSQSSMVSPAVGTSSKSVKSPVDSSGRRSSSASRLSLSMPDESSNASVSGISGNSGSGSGPFLEDKPSPDGNELAGSGTTNGSGGKYSRWIDGKAEGQLNMRSSAGGGNVSPDAGSGRGSPRALEQKASTERLYIESTNKMNRQMRLSMSFVKQQELEIINSDFRNQLGRRQSVSGSSKEEREAALSQIYYDGLKRQNLKEKAMEKMRAESEAKQRNDEKDFTFQPTMCTANSPRSPRHYSHYSVGSANRQSKDQHQHGASSTDSKGKTQKAASATTEDCYDVYDWLAYHSLVDSQNKFLIKREEIETERAQTMNFSPKINDKSETMAIKRRSEKLRQYATAGLVKNRTTNTPQTPKVEQPSPDNVLISGVPELMEGGSPPRMGGVSDESISEVRTEASHEDDISEGFGVQSEVIHNGEVKTEGGTLSFQRHPNHHVPAEDGDGQESVESSVYSTEVLDVTNPFDLIDENSGRLTAHNTAAPSYSPSAYIRSQNHQFEVKIMAHDVDFENMEPAKRADTLFEYLYHGRNDTERARAEAVEKHQEKYSFRPKISRFTNSTIFKKLKPDEFFDKMHKSQKRKMYEEKKPEAKKLNRFEVDEMVKRLNGTNLQRYVDRKAQRKADMDTTLLDRSSICHRFQPRKTRDLTRKAREISTSEIFDVLLMSVEHWHRNKTHAQEEMEEKLEAMPDERERRHSESAAFHKSVERNLEKVRAENHETIMEIEQDLFGAEDGDGDDGRRQQSAQSDHKKANRHDSLSDFAPSSELKGYEQAEGEDQFLDTLHAQPRFLQPLALAEAIEIVIRDARPHRLSREDFIDRVEILIKSGQGPPINAILIAPQRPSRFKHSKEMEVDRHVKPPTLAANKKSTQMVANRTRGNIVDPMKYARDKDDKLQKLREFHEKKEMEGCTFQPSIKTDNSWNAAKKTHDRHYHEIIYKPQRVVSKPVLFKRDSVMKPTTASIKHRASDEQLNRVKENSAREHEQREVIDHVLDEMEGHEVRRHSMEFIYVDSPPPGARKAAAADTAGGRCLSDHEAKREKVKAQHDKEYSDQNAHSAAHVPVFHTHAGHEKEDIQEAVEHSEKKHNTDEFERILAEVEGKIPKEIKEAVEASSVSFQSTASTASSSGGGGYLARHEAVSGKK